MKLSKFYRVVPDEVFLDKNVNLAMLKIYIYLLHYQRMYGDVFPSYDKIAEDTNISRPTIAKSLKKLENLGYITIKRTDGRVNRYRCNNIIGEKSKDENIPVETEPVKKVNSEPVKNFNWNNTNKNNTNTSPKGEEHHENFSTSKETPDNSTPSGNSSGENVPQKLNIKSGDKRRRKRHPDMLEAKKWFEKRYEERYMELCDFDSTDWGILNGLLHKHGWEKVRLKLIDAFERSRTGKFPFADQRVNLRAIKTHYDMLGDLKLKKERERTLGEPPDELKPDWYWKFMRGENC